MLNIRDVSITTKTKILALIFVFLLYGKIIQANISTSTNVNTTSASDRKSNAQHDIGQIFNCEYEGVKSLFFRDESSHTCIDYPILTYIGRLVGSVAGISPYAGLLMRVNMRNANLFKNSNTYPNGQCDKSGRANPSDPRISFGICSNRKIIESSILKAFKIDIAGVRAALTNEDILSAISPQLKFDPEDIYILEKDKPIGYSSSSVEIGITLPILTYRVIRDKDKICVAADTLWSAIGISDSVIIVGCKYIKEPCVGSIYGDFLTGVNKEAKCYEIGSGLNSDNGNNTAATEKPIQDNSKIVQCANMESCYADTVNNSKTLLPITGPIVRCLQQMMKKMIGDSKLCGYDIKGEVAAQNSDNNVLSRFRDHLRWLVVIVLCLYVMFWGVKLLLSMGQVKSSDVAFGILKLILVTYFAIGINVGPDKKPVNGIHDWGMYILNGSVMSEVTNWVTLSVSNKDSGDQSRLCMFDRTEYNPRFRDLALWDAIDCRLTHYLGINAIMDFLREQKLRLSGDIEGDPLGVSVPPYYYLLVPALFSGNITLIMMALSYPMLVIGLVAYMVTSFITCSIGIIILGVLAPIFVPMSLFNYTKGYFDEWVKSIISFILQPMVIMVFIMMSFHIYDYGFYTQCKYNSKEVVDQSNNRTRKMFYIDIKSKSLYGDETKANDNITRCKRSLGWMLNNPIFAIIDSFEGNTVKDLNPHESEITKKFDSLFDDSIIKKDGIIFKTVNLVFQTIRDFIMALFTACIMLYLIQHLSDAISSYIQSLVGGVDISSMVVRPQQAINLMKAGVNYAAGKVAESAAQNAGSDMNSKIDSASSNKENKSDSTTRRGIDR